MTATKLSIGLIALGMLAQTTLAGDGPEPDNRDVQIRSIDFDAGVLELHNFGALDIDLTGWRFCSHDFNEVRRYSSSSGLNGVIIEAGTSVLVYFNDDAPMGNPDALNRSAVGNFAVPLDQDAYGIQIYFPSPKSGSVSFGNSSLIADHLQWNIDGSGVGNAEFRSGQAVSVGLWTAVGQFIATTNDTSTVTLTDLGDGRLHSPANYTTQTMTTPCPADLDGSGTVDLQDLNLILSSFGLNDTGDTNGDMVTDLQDLNAVLAVFGTMCP